MEQQGRLTVLLDAKVRQQLDTLCVQRKTNASTVVRSLVETFVAGGLRDVLGTGAGPAPSRQPSARLTILIGPGLKEAFERACAAEDLTVSQVVRRLIRAWMQPA